MERSNTTVHAKVTLTSKTMRHTQERFVSLK